MVNVNESETPGRSLPGSGELAAVGAASTGVGAALLATVTAACCSGPVLAPLVVAVLGAGGAAWAAGLKPYTPWLFAGSLALLGVGFRMAYGSPGTCDGACRRSHPLVRGVLWVAAAVWLAAVGIAAWSWLAPSSIAAP